MQVVTCAIPDPIKPLPMTVMFFIAELEYFSELVLKLDTAGRKALDVTLPRPTLNRSLLE